MRSFFLIALMVCLFLVGTIFAADGVLPGEGIETNPYLIEDFKDFQAFADSANATKYWAEDVYTQLNCNIDLDPNLPGREIYTTAVIAPDTSASNGFQGTAYSGILKGQNFIISNFNIRNTRYTGLFGLIKTEALISNITLDNCNVYGWNYIGGLCGISYGRISNCFVNGSITGRDYVGGLCGLNSGIIENCNSSGFVTGLDSPWRIGGLCGDNTGNINNCYSNSSIVAEKLSQRIGGFCGINNGAIENCYSSGPVSVGDRSESVGGFCGRAYGNVSKCYSSGLVSSGTGSYYIGGFCGYELLDCISNCYFYLLNGPNNNSGTVLDRTEMKTAANFVGFDFSGDPSDGNEEHWKVENGYCPKQSWQIDDGPSLPAFPETTLIGSGTPDNPFQINNETDFDEFRTKNFLDRGYYVLMTDIDLSGLFFNTAVIDKWFGGHFDGNGHIVSGMTIYSVNGEPPIEHYLGLFSKICGSVSNLNLNNVSITIGDYREHVGGLCGWNYGGRISNCYLQGGLNCGSYGLNLGGLCGNNEQGNISECQSNISINSSNSENIGGLCGINYEGNISNCYSNGPISGGSYVGGLCGYNDNGNITACYSTSQISSCRKYSGGLCGWNSGIIRNCYSTGLVTGRDYGSENLGGLCGYNTGEISDCHSFSSVTSQIDSLRFGGLCGINYGGVVRNCFSTGSVIGGNHSQILGGLCGSNSGNIANSYSSGSVFGKNGFNMLGGLCGGNGGTISSCFSMGSVNGQDNGSNIGGLCGVNGGIVSDSYTTGPIEVGFNASYVGGFCGINTHDPTKVQPGNINNCYTVSKITYSENVNHIGSLCGLNYDSEIFNSYWNSEISSVVQGYDFLPTNLGVVTNVVGKSTLQIQTLSTFADAGWDFSEADGDAADWVMLREGEDYPRLAWQAVFGGDVAGLYGVDFADLAYFAGYWGMSDCGGADDCGDADIDGVGGVGVGDLAIIAEQWLAGK